MLISIIIPVYKVERYIHECIQSVLKQDFYDYEVILVNDGSPDNCPQICDDYAAKYDQIKVVHKCNGGLSDARNVGILNASGNYVTFLDSDDYLSDYNVLRAFSEIDSVGDLDIIIYSIINNHSCKKEKKIPDYITKMNDAQEVIIALIKENCFFENACAKFINRKFILKNELFFEKNILHEDFEWILRMCMYVKRIKIIDKKIYYYRNNTNSIMGNISLKNIQDLRNTIQKHSEIIRDKDINIEYQNGLLSQIALTYYATLGYISTLSNEKIRKEICKIKESEWLIDYTSNRQGKLHKVIYKAVGIRLYIKIRKYVCIVKNLIKY